MKKVTIKIELILIFILFFSCEKKQNDYLKKEFKNSWGKVEYDEKGGAKFYDKNGILYNEYRDKFHHKNYQYYKDKSLYKIDFLKDIYIKDSLKYVRIDSSILYSFKTKKEILKCQRLDTIKTDKRVVLFYYKNSKIPIKSDTIENWLRTDQIEKKLLGADTIQLQYIPRTKF